MQTRFERLHPLVTFLYYAGSVALFILMLHPVFLGLGFIIILVINLLQDRFQGVRRWLIFILFTFLLMLIMNPLFNERGRHVLFEINQHRFTLEALFYGGMNALAIIGIIVIFVSYNIVMTPNKQLFLFAKILPQFAVLLMLTLRFIPLMRRRLEEISVIQKSKGFSVSQGKWQYKMKNALLFVQALLTYSLEEAIQTADSMKARGYGTGKRTTYEHFTIYKGDMIAVLYLVLLFTCAIYGRVFGYGFLQIYPIMESWHLAVMDGRTLMFYLLFLSFPIFVEAGGMFRWR